MNWKIGTSRKLIKRTILISSSELLLSHEMNFIQNIFTKSNDYPLKVANKITDQEFSQLAQEGPMETKNQHTLKNIQLMVPYSGKQGHQLQSKMKKKTIKKIIRGY